MTSSLKFSSTTSIRKEDLKKMNTVLQTLVDNNDSIEFRNPVDHIALGLTDYPLVVKKPMDLSTARTQLNNNKYDYIEDFLDDVQLIWDNCKAYNSQGSWIWKLADKLDKYYRKLIKNYLPMIMVQCAVVPKGSKKEEKQAAVAVKQVASIEETIDSHQEEKSAFASKAQQLSEEQLGQIIEQIQLESPAAFQKVANKKLQITIDKISPDVLYNLNIQIDQWLTPQPKTLKKHKA